MTTHTARIQGRKLACNSAAWILTDEEIAAGFSPMVLGAEGSDKSWKGSIVRIGVKTAEHISHAKRSGVFNLVHNVQASLGYLNEGLANVDGVDAEDQYMIAEAWVTTVGACFDKWALKKGADAQEKVLMLTLRKCIASPMKSDLDLPSNHRLCIPFGMVEFVQWQVQGQPLPRAGFEYAEHMQYVYRELYKAVNQEFEGYSNRPTACLAMGLLNSAQLMRQVSFIRTKKGIITGKGLAQMVGRTGLCKHLVPDDAYYTEGFPRSFAESINFDEVAMAVNEKFESGAFN